MLLKTLLAFFLAFKLIPASPVPVHTTHSAFAATNKTHSFEAYFDKYSSQYKVNKNTLKAIAMCESTMNPKAVNYIYAGMFQYDEQTWIAVRKEMKLDPNPQLRFSAKEAIETTAYKIAQEGTGAWPVCGLS
jgi:hypothetical protein